MLCKFTTDAIQLFFFVFLPQIYKKNWMLICCFGYEKIVVSAMQNCRVIR